MNDQEIENEYSWEYLNHWKHSGLFPTVNHFKKAIKNSKIMEVTPEMDAKIQNRSRCDSIDELKGLTSRYKFPRDVNRIVQGLKTNQKLPMPVVIKHNNLYHVMSGNTRMDASFIHNINPFVHLIDMDSKIKKSEYFGDLIQKATIHKEKAQKALMPNKAASVKSATKRKPNAITLANKQIEPLMHDVQNAFSALKQKIYEAAKNPDVPQNKQLMEKFLVKVTPKGEIKADNHRVMRAVVEEEWRKNPARFIPRITVDNSKLQNEAIGAWTTPAVITCPGARDCKSFCFAKNDQIQYKNSLAKRFVNMYSRSNPEFANHIQSQLDSMKTKREVQVQDWNKPIEWRTDKKGGKVASKYEPAKLEAGQNIVRRWNTFRIHDSGDFDSPEYADQWRKIVESNPDTSFYAYTKSYSHPEIWARLKSMHDQLPNFKIIQSVGGEDEKIDPTYPHAVIFENEDQINRAGYVPTHDYDSRAADKNLKDHGLVIFGGGKGKYGSLKDHLKRAHGIRHKLKREGNIHPEEYQMPEAPSSSAPKPETLQASEFMNRNIPSREMVHAYPDSDEAHQALQPDYYHQQRIATLDKDSSHPLKRLIRD